MLHEMLQFKSAINIYKIVLSYNVTQLKGNTTPLTALFFYNPYEDIKVSYLLNLVKI